MGETNEMKRKQDYLVSWQPKKKKKEEVISKEEYVNSEFPHCYVKYEYK